jgi:energy-coupling factor transporter ATP-binding protein EcfA2
MSAMLRSLEKIDRYAACVDALSDEIPPLAAALDRSADDLPGWRAMQMRLRALSIDRGRPMLVATMFGPSGGGKSTLFRLLTGVDVPAGGEVRPMTHAPVAAVPRSLCEIEQLERLFPFYRLEPFVDAEQLRSRQIDSDCLFFAPYDEPPGDEQLQLTLVDAPDFNTVETANWEKAERMLERAETTLFVAYDESYSDHRVVSQLAVCCRKAGFLAYLFTKTAPEAAKLKWEHLLSLAAERADQFGFDQLRADGRTTLDFLSAAPVYCSSRSSAPTLDDVRSLSPDGASLESLLRGQQGGAILLAALAESSLEAVESCRKLSDEAARRRGELQRKLTAIDRAIERHARQIAGSEFPAGRVMQLAVQTSRTRMNRTVWMMRLPLAWAAKGIGGWIGSAKRMLGSLGARKRGDGAIVERGQLEGERLAAALESLVESWRLEYPQEAIEGGLLSAARFEAARTAFANRPLPAPADDWERYVVEEIDAWCAEHRWRSTALATLHDALTLSGLALVVIDLATTGGFFHTTFGLIGAAGAGSAAAGRMVDWFEKWDLKRVADEADRRWLEQRGEELSDHLRSGIVEPLFQSWRRQFDAARPEAFERIARACDELEKLTVTRETPT